MRKHYDGCGQLYKIHTLDTEESFATNRDGLPVNGAELDIMVRQYCEETGKSYEEGLKHLSRTEAYRKYTEQTGFRAY